MVKNALEAYTQIKNDPNVKQSRTWSDTFSDFSNNFGPDLERLITQYLIGQVQTAQDPVGTISNITSNMYDMGSGVASKVIDAAGFPTTGDIKYYREKPLDDYIQEQINNFGSIEGFKNHLAEEPVQTTAEILGLIGGGANIARRMAPNIPALLADESGALKLAPLANTPDEIKPGDLRVSTRFPTVKNRIEDPLTQQLNVGKEEYTRSPAYLHNTKLLSSYPGFARLKGMSPEEAVNEYIRQGADNLIWLYKNSPEVMQQRSPLWYDGANTIANALGERWGIPQQSVSGGMAALSPQLDWFVNATQAERIGDILFGPASSTRMTPEMVAHGKSLSSLQNGANNAAFKRIIGKRLSDITDPHEQAIWIRLYDELNNPQMYRSVTPEGNYADFVRNEDGTPSKSFWLNYGNMAKAIKSYTSGGDMNIISPLLGEMHKVRNFYNNISVPNDTRYGDVTGDTHQVAALQLRPLSGSSVAVSQHFGTGLPKDKQPKGYIPSKGSDLDAVMGLYPLTSEATRLASKELEMLPRQAQSGTWEPVRELFTDVFKRSKNAGKIDDIWRAYDNRDLTIDEAREQILDTVGGIKTPEWGRPNLKVFDPKRSSTYR